MASVKKRTTAAGEARYDIRYRDPSGTVRTQTFRTRRDADRYARQIETAKDRGEWLDPTAGTVTLEDYAATWLNQRTLRPRTRTEYRGVLDRHLLPEMGSYPLAKITTAKVRAWHASKLADGPGAPTVAKSYRLLRAILNTAVEDELIGRNPCIIKGAGVETSPERPVATPEQVWQLADAIEARYRVMVLSAAFLGLRFGELAGLARRHVNVLHRTITVERQLVELGGVRSFGPPKTEAGVRSVTIPAELLPLIEDHLDAFVGADPDALVFSGGRGAPLSRSHWTSKWGEARAAVELPDGFRFHDLRHTALTIAATTGASTRELMRRAGHASPIAALRYQHATDERDREIADQVGEILGRARDGRAMEPGS